MITQKIAPNIYAVSLGFVNVFLIDADELTLVDTGIPGSEQKIFQAISELGHAPQDLRQILITHLHFDHTGSLVPIQQASGARISMHALDAEAYSSGKVMRSVEPAPGLINKLIVNNLNRRRPVPAPERAVIDQMITNDGEIAGTGGLQAIHTPGHTVGHIAFYFPRNGGSVILGDAASNMLHLGYSFLYEDFNQGKQTLKTLCALPFSTACFSHGKAILSGANEKFKKTFQGN
jgi:glyoxylase-like metal-dependent hydrolase (beta-lactamase superfamily II)